MVHRYGRWGRRLPESQYKPIRRRAAEAAVSLYDKGFRDGWGDGWDHLENDVARALGIPGKTAEEGEDFVKIVQTLGKELKRLQRERRKHPMGVAAKQWEATVHEELRRAKASGDAIAIQMAEWGVKIVSAIIAGEAPKPG